MTTLLESQPIFHGPAESPRWGAALTIDLTSPQIHMALDRSSSLPRASVIVTGAARRMIAHSKAQEKLNHVVVLGTTTDPGAHPDLKEITENLRALRDKWFNRSKLVLVTRLQEAESSSLRTTIGMYDKVVARMEWGTAKTYSTMTGEKSTRLADITKQLGQFSNVIIEAEFSEANSTDGEVKGWIKRLQELQPKEVHVLYSKSVVAAGGKKLRAVTPKRRQQIVDAAIEATGLPITVHEIAPPVG